MAEEVILPPPPDDEGSFKKHLKRLRRCLFGDELDSLRRASGHDAESARRIERLIRER